MRLTLKRKFMGGTLLLSLLVVILGWMSFKGMEEAYDDLLTITQSGTILNDDVLPLQYKIVQLRSLEMEYLLNTGNARNQKSVLEQFTKTSDDIASEIAGLQSLDLASSGLARDVTENIKHLDTLFLDYKTGFQKMVQGVQAEDDMTAQKLDRILAPRKERARDVLNALSVIGTAGEAMQSKAVAEGLSTLKANRLAIILIALFVALIAPVLSWALSRSMTVPIAHIVDFTKKFSKGDLSERLPMGKPMPCSNILDCGQNDCHCFGQARYCWVDAGIFSNYPTCPKVIAGESCTDCIVYRKGVRNELEELGSSINGLANELDLKARVAAGIARGDLNQKVHVASKDDVLGKSLEIMVHYLNDILVQVKETSLLVATGSTQVSDSSISLSQGATEQAASLEEIESSIAEVSSQTRNNAENSSQANRLSLSAREAADKGNHRMQSMIEAMGDISESSKEIANIIKTIDEIAFQTNLLALNAAVEAARAGKHGKGFAVVAQEVRNLAGRSAKAAGETAELIEKSVNSVENGAAIVSETAEALNEITETATKTADLIGEIATSSNEQAKGITQIDQGLKQIELVTQQNTANAEQTSAAAEELASQASRLNKMMTRFKLMEKQKVREDKGLELPARESIPRIGAGTPADAWAIPPAPAPALPPAKKAVPKSEQLIKWNSSFSVGVAEIDRQHQDLVRYINTLYSALKQGKGQEILYETIMNLIGYTKLHFATEEKYFNQFGYPDSAAHKKEHQFLIKEVMTFKEKLDNGQTAVSVKLIDFLKDWLLNHISETDKQYGPFFNRHGLK